MELKWLCRHFSELNAGELYALLQLRSAVFVVEQNCPYQDADDKDQNSFHLLGLDALGRLGAYSRILPPAVSFPEVSIGRVCTSALYRRGGHGKVLMEQSIRTIRQQYGPVPVRIGAQLYLKKFYEAFGFRKDSEEYLEDGIPHIEMLLS
jgi:ElaA protein